MNKIQINIRIDKQLKENVEIILDDMGLTLQEAIKIFLKKIENKREIPFKISSDKMPSELLKMLNPSEKSEKKLISEALEESRNEVGWEIDDFVEMCNRELK